MKTFMKLLTATLAVSAVLPAAAAGATAPATYLATLQFDGKDNFDSGEQNFPQPFRFTGYDTNIEHNKENLVRFKIGSSIYGTGSTGWANRGPNDQRPAVYFHFVRSGGYDVYQYWLYYADNDYINDHEHDWEKYYVYEQNGVPTHLLISDHNTYHIYKWADVPKDNAHPKISVDGGAHAMKLSSEDGVRIRYNGAISKNNGRLDQGDLTTVPWVIYSNEAFSGVTSYSASPNVFYGGDPEYSTNSNEYGSPSNAPWVRGDWTTPALP
ncbi:hypothetical protein CBW65_23420 [Tumebacillus avium]|uniref:Necrosis inducing protein (NPP1) n=1 Tax=Tumebacillus avium TaxID=1903704 RepID=A0A1Y0IV18_9BACL|nr:NPP1 family protein [Tumebacillus avium]ARU63636.1 hypothetical protein CBW65_23420 [Tumebacillus avium]